MSEVRAGKQEGLPLGQCGGASGGARGAGPSALGVRARAERTANMACMSVTLDVSKFSGWLNADARCRVERRLGHAMQGEVHARRTCGVVAAQAACTRGGRPDSRRVGGQGKHALMRDVQ